MKLTKARVQKFRSIEDSTDVSIDPAITVLVGQNESGKTAFLQALDKCRSSDASHQFNVTEDYPRRSLTEYQKRHEKEPQNVVALTYQLSTEDIKYITQHFSVDLSVNDVFTMTHSYANNVSTSFSIPEKDFVARFLKAEGLSPELQQALASNTVRELLEKLKAAATEEAQRSAKKLSDRFLPGGKAVEWANLLAHDVWASYIGKKIPKFFYFDDYFLLPGKVNLADLTARANAKNLSAEQQTVISLLSMADVSLQDLSTAQGYENVKAKLEGISNSITDTIFKYWKQNKDLHVEFDIRTDSHDAPPFQNGPNLYIRIRNNRHRVSVPFSQRSKGFIWFFSFIVWFDTIKEKESIPPILLLDEPGLSLHALAQEDLLGYIDDLAVTHQILYSTHSPFMVKGDALHQARLVEDKPESGSTVTDNISTSDRKTIFPLQAALGYTIAQNLFISPRNLLVEGPADLVYLQYFSNQLEIAGRTGLRSDITIVPVGGLDKVSTFVALLGANRLETVVLHDFNGQPDARLESLAREKLIKEKHILHYGLFRVLPKGVKQPAPSDVEDLMSEAFYLSLFSDAFKSKLKSAIAPSDLPKRDRIIQRIEAYLEKSKISLRPSGGFNHYTPANFLASSPRPPDAQTLDCFEAVFKAANSLFTS